MDNRKRILICIDWYEPGFKAGGPIRSVANLVNSLKHEFEFYILTSAYDLGETEPYSQVPVDEWLDQDGVFIKYLGESNLRSGAIRGNIIEIDPDVIYLNSMFSKLFTIVPLMLARRKRIKVILAPRGMLGQGAVNIKGGKKKSFLFAARLSGMYRRVTWHASTAEEKSEIHDFFGKKADVVVAQNIALGQKILLDDIMNKKKTGHIRFVFISRIALKKNLHLAVDALQKIKLTGPVEFHIYGNVEEKEYFESFMDQIKDYDNLSMKYKGVLRPDEISEVYSNADFLLLPTMHENYGHAIVEAWSNGCPVIISNNTPWKNLRVQDLGWDVDLSKPENFVNAIQEAVDLDFTSYIAMVRASYNYFKNNISEAQIITDNFNLFDNAN